MSDVLAVSGIKKSLGKKVMFDGDALADYFNKRAYGET